MPFTFKKLELDGVVLVEPRVFKDDRGFFMETYKMLDFVEAGIKDPFVQDNHSRSTKGVLRGLHYQRPPYAQGKLVRAIRGEVFDVAVDIRKDSTTYGKWIGITLSEENRKMLYIPPGFAHGYLVLSEIAEFAYKATSVYAPDHEEGIIWNASELNIDWPIKEPILSESDMKWPSLRDASNG